MKENDYAKMEFSEIQAKDISVRQYSTSGEFVGDDIGRHLTRLANTAFATGKKEIADLILQWVLNPPTKNILHRAWAMYSLLHSGFWSTAESVIIKNLEDHNGRKAIHDLISEARIAPTPDMGYMSIGLSQEEQHKFLQLLGNKLPWVEEDDRFDQLTNKCINI